MKKTILIILLFFVLFVSFDRFFSFIIVYAENNFFNKSSMKEPLKKYLKNKDFNTLLFGTSRTYEGIHPENFKDIKELKMFKIAFVGHGPKYNYFFYKMYKREAGIPEYLIYGIDYFIFNLKTPILPLSEVEVDESQKVKIDFFSPSFLLLKNKKKNDIFFNDTIEFLKYKSDESRVKFLSDLQVYLGADKALFKKHKVITEKPRKYKRIGYFPSPGKEGYYFSKLLDQLKKDKVKVIFVIIPEHFGTFKTNWGRKKLYIYLDEIKKKYENIKVWNFNKRKIFTLHNSEYFLDGGYGKTNSHLSKKGSMIFNQKLKVKLKNYLKKNK